MSLSSDLISQFVKITKDEKKAPSESTVYGKTVTHNGSIYVQLDGSEQLTPVSNTANIGPGERVMVMIKNHTATVTGNLTSPSARIITDENGNQTVEGLDVEELIDQVSEFEIIVADKVSTGELAVERGRIDVLVTENTTIKERLTASEGDIDTLQAGYLTVTEKLTATDASIENLETTKLDVTIADAKFATIEELDATNADIHNLEATYGEFVTVTTDDLSSIHASINDLEADMLTVGAADLKYANIDFSNIGTAAIEQFFSKSGLIEDVIVGDGTVTGHLVGVTISGDLIEGNTVKAEKLVIKGTDGLYYKLNTDGMTTEAEQTDQNSLNGSVIKAKSITATKISVSDLVAFGATIGGFHITNSAIYSGAKSTVGNTTRGIYMDTDGQMGFGDSSRFVKFFKDTDGSYKLAISADSILFGTDSKSVETAISDVQKSVDDIEIGGRNLALGTAQAKTATGTGIENECFTLYHRTPYTYSCFDSSPVTLSFDWESTATSGTFRIQQNNTPWESFWKYRVTVSETNQSGHMSCTLYDTFDEESNAETWSGWGLRLDNFVGDLTIRNFKIELGNKPTDWTAAPEDMATTEELDGVVSTVENTQSRVAAAEALIEILSESISMLVTDGSGASLMTQTENGWTFSTAEIQAVVDRVSEGLTDLTNEVGDVNSTVSILQQAVDDLGEIAEYVKIGTYEDEPCIELGEGDSDFKLRITNTRMIFTEGSVILAYFNNQSLHIKKAVVEEELQQGGFVWKVRSNGNMGLVWKGVTS